MNFSPARICSCGLFIYADGMPTVRIPITKQVPADTPVIPYLQTDLANAWVLYANYKHYHWESYGPLFHDLHVMFDDFAEAVFDTIDDFAEAVVDTIDDFAERIRKLGFHIEPVQLTQFQSAAIVQSSSASLSEVEMIQEAHANLLLVIQRMRIACRIADDNNDPGTVDLYSKTVQIHEKAEWFLRQVLATQDGLVSNGQ